MEQWRQMKYPYNNYDISNHGNLRNNKTHYYFTLSEKESSYIRVSLNKKNFLLHRLVAEHFLNNYDEKLIINHIDGNRINNNISNLECITIKENNQKVIFKNEGTKFREIAQYDIDNNLIKIYYRVKDIKNISSSELYKSINSNSLYKGFYWKFHIDKIENEIWKSLNFINDDIKISNFGRIKTISGKITYGCKSRSGYYNIQISNKPMRIHRLVCMIFKPIDNYDKLVVNHIDGNRGNNRVDNLEWCTHSENSKHGYKINKTIRNIRRVKVIRVDLFGNEIEYESLEIACQLNNMKNKSNIISVCKNKRKSANGYSWKYA